MSLFLLPQLHEQPHAVNDEPFFFALPFTILLDLRPSVSVSRITSCEFAGPPPPFSTTSLFLPFPDDDANHPENRPVSPSVVDALMTRYRDVASPRQVVRPKSRIQRVHSMCTGGMTRRQREKAHDTTHSGDTAVSPLASTPPGTIRTISTINGDVIGALSFVCPSLILPSSFSWSANIISTPLVYRANRRRLID